MKKLFECDICGNRSEDEKEIFACEAQDKNNKYGQEALVFVHYEHRADLPEVVGIVSAVLFGKITHAPAYDIKIGPAAQAVLNIINLDPNAEFLSIGVFEESELKPAD